MILKTEERTIKDNYLLYGEQMENILDFFRENEEAFIVYVVEQRFATGRGLDYFKSFKGKPNLIDSNIKIRRLLRHIIFWISRHVPSIGTVIGTCFGGQVTALNIANAQCTTLCVCLIRRHHRVKPKKRTASNQYDMLSRSYCLDFFDICSNRCKTQGDFF